MCELLAELRPSVLADSSLSDLLRQLANAFTGRTNVPASVTTAAEHVLSADIQVALYRICQEALNNVAKHAAASRVEIDLYLDTGAAQVSSFLAPAGAPQEIVVSSVELRIRDDGHGFDPAQPATSGHFGLGMMRERAEAVGARLTVTSLPGHGTEITVRWQKTPEQEAR
jgi:signal transduction histidine kinase